ncbi:MAG TPA: ATP-binding protein [Vicinamibacterales bacterium]|nr:ATP-binding protein [Vicinamibacterales bacterium]
MPADNPFVYGEVVPVWAFVDREAERDRLVADLAACQKVFLISPRRYGKSSLIRQALRTLDRRRVVTLELTVSSFSSYVAFLEGYARALVGLETRTGRVRTWLRDLFKGVTPELRIEAGPPGGKLALSFPGVRTARDAARLAEEVFALPARLATRLGRPLVVALDEFQAIAAFDGGSVEQALRAAVQQQRRVGYVFAGSEPSLMEQMIGPRRPFYKAGPVMRLQKIPADVFAEAVESRFNRSGVAPEAGLGAAIVDLAGNLPYDVQRLAHETWDDATAAKRRRVSLDDLHATLHRLLAEQETIFEAMWERLTLVQRAVLRAVVLERGVEMLSADTRARYRLGGPSSVQTALSALVRLDLIAREEDGHYVVVDSLTREWVARRTY